MRIEGRRAIFDDGQRCIPEAKNWEHRSRCWRVRQCLASRLGVDDRAATVGSRYGARSRALKYIVSLAALLLTATVNLVAGEDEAAIRAAGSLWTQHYSAGDLDALMTLYVDDVVVALHGQPALYGREAVRDYFAPRIGKADVTFELDYEVIEVHGDVGYIISKYWLRAVDRESGGVYKDAGRSMLVYKKGADGSWKIAADVDRRHPTWLGPRRQG